MLRVFQFREKKLLHPLKTSLPHLILMDINIKGELDGIETAERISELADIPIIYVTSNTSSPFVNRALETRPHAFISKPYNLRDLVIAIELAMKKHTEYAIESKNVESVFVKSGEYHRKIEVKRSPLY